MDRKWYYWCAVPLCTNTSKTAPHKVFVPVPFRPEIRQKWFQIAKRKDAAQLSPKSVLYFCEDHFDLPNDMENYVEYKVMGSVKNIRMKTGCMPSRFDSHPNQKRRLPSHTITSKYQRAELIKDAESSIQIPNSTMPKGSNVPVQHTDTVVLEANNQTNQDNLLVLTTSDKSDMSVIEESVPAQSSKVSALAPSSKVSVPAPSNKVSSVPALLSKENVPARSIKESVLACTSKQDKGIQTQSKRIQKQSKKIQVSVKHPYRSKETQTAIKLLNKATSPRKNNVDATTSPLKVEIDIRKQPVTTLIPKELFGHGKTSDSDKLTSSVCASPSYVASLQSKISSEYSSFSEADAELKNQWAKLFLENTLMKLKKRPRFYIGVPENCYFSIDIISKTTNILEEHILICLKKIRLDTKFTELADEFDMSISKVSKIFMKNTPIIAKSLKSFILKLNAQDPKIMKKNLPIAFRHNYNEVNSIIDCFEIEIQKPSKAVHQALTWSEYKKGNTVKYLISSTPDGLVNFISAGYGGRTSDTLLVEDCGFLDELCSGSYILADHGFKNIEQLLLQKGCHLLRPPSVTADSKLSKKDVRITKQIASLRIHIERVIRRVREFKMLKPHSVVNSKLVHILDECVIVACALINLQDSIVK